MLTKTCCKTCSGVTLRRQGRAENGWTYGDVKSPLPPRIQVTSPLAEFTLSPFAPLRAVRCGKDERGSSPRQTGARAVLRRITVRFCQPVPETSRGGRSERSDGLEASLCRPEARRYGVSGRSPWPVHPQDSAVDLRRSSIKAPDSAIDALKSQLPGRLRVQFLARACCKTRGGDFMSPGSD